MPDEIPIEAAPHLQDGTEPLHRGVVEWATEGRSVRAGGCQVTEEGVAVEVLALTPEPELTA